MLATHVFFRLPYEYDSSNFTKEKNELIFHLFSCVLQAWGSAAFFFSFKLHQFSSFMSSLCLVIKTFPFHPRSKILCFLFQTEAMPHMVYTLSL